jgi:hypothetical protein
MEPLPLDPEQPKHTEINLIKPFNDVVEEYEQAMVMIRALRDHANDPSAAQMVRAMQEQVKAIEARIGRAGLNMANLKSSPDRYTERPPQPRLKVTITEYPPTCCDTREGLAEFASTLPAVRVAFRNGGWGHLAKLARCWAGYWLGRAVVRASVPEAWLAIHVVR